MIERKWGVSMTVYRKRVFPLLAGLLWLTFLTLDLTGWGDSTWVKFAAICLCCATALTGLKTTDGKLVALALCLTVGADWFLLVRRGESQADQMVGIGLFIVVQLIYAYRLYCMRGRKLQKWGLVLRLSLCVGSLLFLPLSYCFLPFCLKSVPPLAEFALYLLFFFTNALYSAYLLFTLPIFYFLNLCLNAAEAFVQKKRTFALGLLLFVLCDVCVGAYNLGIFVSFTWWGSWLFYLPSQVLIVLSQELEKGDLDEKRF